MSRRLEELPWPLIIAVIGLGIGGFHYLTHRPIHHPVGVITAAADPEQTDTTDPAFIKGKYTIQPLANFTINARVLSAEHYHWDTESDLSPVDLALGWGQMSDTGVINQLDISQSGRWYYYSYQIPPIAVSDIVSHSANMHMLPANDRIASKLKDIRVGQIVHISGNLVEVDNPVDHWKWRSSLTRTDSGAGACEVVWVKQLYVTDN